MALMRLVNKFLIEEQIFSTQLETLKKLNKPDIQ